MEATESRRFSKEWHRSLGPLGGSGPHADRHLARDEGVAGSSLPLRPTFSMHEWLGPDMGKRNAFVIERWPPNEFCGPYQGAFLSQLSDYESGGQEFESLRARQ